MTVDNVTATSVSISWLPLDSMDIHGYVAVCLQSVTSDILVLNVENALSSNTAVHDLKSYRRYQVKVFALVKDRGTGVITLKSSKKTYIRTKEDGE